MNSTNSPAAFPERRAENEALRWLIDLDDRDDRDDLNEAERAQFRAWLDERPENRRAFANVARDWQRLDIVRRLATDTPDPRVVNKWLRRRRIRRRYLPFAAAAGVAALAFTLFLPTPPELEASYRTAIGEHRRILLPDDSVLTLNTNSEANVVYTADYRYVHLHRGEAHFEIAPASERPFSVEAGLGTVRAVGTSFNVYVKNDLVEVTVTEGVVEVMPLTPGLGAGAVDPRAPPARSAAAVFAERLHQGERLRYRDSIESKSKVDSGALARKLAWQDGMLDFEGDTLASVIEEAGRYTTTRLMIADPGIANSSVTGYFRAGDVESLLGLIESNEGLAVRRVTPDLVHIIASRD